MAIAVDASSPIRWTGTISSGGTITSASFTAPANALLVITCQGDSNAGTSAHDVTCADSGGLAWTEQVARLDQETTLGGCSAIFTARTTSATSRTVSVGWTGGAGGTNRRYSAKAYVLTGVDVDGVPVDTVGANNEGGSTTNNLTTTSLTPGATGLLIATSCDWSASGSFEASSNLTQDTTTYAGAISVCSGYRTCASGVGVSGNLNAAGGAAAQHKWVQLVLREAAAAATTAVLPPAFRFVTGRVRNQKKKRRAS
jgi:hypothetical protein